MAVLVLIATLLLCVPTPQSEQNQSVHNGALPTQSQSGKAVPVITLNSQSTQPNRASNTDHSQTQLQMPQRDLITTLYYISGPLVFIVSFATGILVWRQIRAIRRIERAWLGVGLVKIPKEGRTFVEYRPTADSTFVHPFLLAKNHGKTPAWIIDWKIWCETTDIYSEGGIVKPRFKFKPRKIKGGITMIGAGEEREFSLTGMLKGRVEQKPGTILQFYGFVRYRDIFGKTSKTHFGVFSLQGTDMFCEIPFADFYKTP
jgi:hypothetical protein